MDAVRYSRWAAEPGSWSSYEQELYSFQCELHRRRRRMHRIAALLLIPCDLLALVGAFLPYTEWAGLIVLAMVVLIVGPILNAKSNRILREMPADVPLDYCGDGIYNCPVRIRIMQGMAVTGADSGIVWVQNGMLHYVGRFTSFAVPGRVFRGRKMSVLEKGSLGMYGVMLDFDASPRGLPLRVWMEQLAGETSLSAESAIGAILASCSTSPTGVQAGQLPPAEIGPGAWLPGACVWTLAKRIGWALAGISFVVGWCLRIFYHDIDMWMMFSLFGIGAIVMVFFAFRSAAGTAASLRHIRTVRRLERHRAGGTLGPELQVELHTGT